MEYDLLHIDGKPYVLIPLHEYRQMTQPENGAFESGLPEDILDLVHARQEHPVKILRKFRGMTQEDLATAAQISRPYIAGIETGKKQGSLAAMRALATALNVPSNLLI